MKQIILVVMFVLSLGAVQAKWESGCVNVVAGSDTSIQMEDWNNTFCDNNPARNASPMSSYRKKSEVVWKDVYEDCDTDASYLADPKK